MLSTIQSCIKFILFATFILILGNAVRWEGKTLSDQVKIAMSHAEESQIYSDVQSWAKRVTSDAKKGVQNKVHSTLSLDSTVDEKSGEKNTDKSAQKEQITHTERQKLKALIKELNSTHRTN